MFYREIKYCRLCRHQGLMPLFGLGDQAVMKFLVSHEDPVCHGPLDLVQCEECRLVQLRHSFDRNQLYATYYYRSAMSNYMRNALTEVALKGREEASLKPGDQVLDIGANDWYFLDLLPDFVSKVGVDPARNIARWDQPRRFRRQDHRVCDYFSWEHVPESVRGQYFKLITSLAMFYDLEDPLQFCADIADLLHPEGVWVNQLNYAPLVMKNVAYDFISHEHATYWTLKTFQRVLDQVDLDVIDVEVLPLNGGTARFLVAHQGQREVRPAVFRQFEYEEEHFSNNPGTWQEFYRRVQRSAADLSTLVSHLVDQGKKVYAYGASTRGNVILQYCGLGPYQLQGVVDIDPEKVGKFMTGSRLPVVSERMVQELGGADYYLALPYSYLETFIEKEQIFLEKGGKFIAPLPEVKVVP